MITIAEEIAVPSAPKRVWEVVSDPSAVVSCIGGAELGRFHDDGSFDAALVVRFGGIRVRFGARITLELDEAEREGRITGRGRDGQGATRFTGTTVFRVTDEPATGGSRVTMSGEVRLSGKLASLIESGAGAVVARMTQEFSAALVERCVGPPTDLTDNKNDGTSVRLSLWRRLRVRWNRLLRRRGQSAPPSPVQSEEAARGSAAAQ
ncbi:SRPBCC domain-containing protein [Streptomyces sp. MMG1533]|uniref:SRPBCC domain-containing protein n=1 Tax=Streptomyces sp. MMG1533 TaxID=1415546 RepID=UPI0007C7E540|nr:SRPBCC domain-containing protein [Streptomyces sp. MMG1533]